MLRSPLPRRFTNSEEKKRLRRLNAELLAGYLRILELSDSGAALAEVAEVAVVLAAVAAAKAEARDAL